MSTPRDDNPKKKKPGKRVNASGVGSTPSQPQQFQHTGNSTAAQLRRALDRLRLRPATTCDLRRYEDIYDPPARILQLRKLGHQIDTVWDMAVTEAGVAHRVGKYVLIKEAA